MKLRYMVSYKDEYLKPSSSDEPYYFNLRRHADNFVKQLIKEHQNIEDWKVEEVVLGHGTDRN